MSYPKFKNGEATVCDARVVQNFGKLHISVCEYNLLLFTKGKVRSAEYLLLWSQVTIHQYPLSLSHIHVVVLGEFQELKNMN